MWFNILCSVFHSDSGLNRDEDQEFVSALLLLFYPDEGMVKSQILVHPNQILLQFCWQKSMLSPAAHVPVQWWWRAGKSFTPLLFSLRGITECSWIPPTPEQQQYVNNNVSDPDGFFFYHSLGWLCRITELSWENIHAKVSDKALGRKLLLDIRGHDKMCIDLTGNCLE